MVFGTVVIKTQLPPIELVCIIYNWQNYLLMRSIEGNQHHLAKIISYISEENRLKTDLCHGVCNNIWALS